MLAALEQALYTGTGTNSLAHQKGHGSQYLSIRYLESLAGIGIEASVGSREVEYATLE